MHERNHQLNLTENEMKLIYRWACNQDVENRAAANKIGIKVDEVASNAETSKIINQIELSEA